MVVLKLANGFLYFKKICLSAEIQSMATDNIMSWRVIWQRYCMINERSPEIKDRMTNGCRSFISDLAQFLMSSTVNAILLAHCQK